MCVKCGELFTPTNGHQKQCDSCFEASLPDDESMVAEDIIDFGRADWATRDTRKADVGKCEGCSYLTDCGSAYFCPFARCFRQAKNRRKT